MQKKVILLIIFLPAFLAGLGFIANFWMIASAIVAFGNSTMIAADTANIEDFRDLKADQFRKANSSVSMLFVMQVVGIALAYGLGKLVSKFL